MIIYLHSRDFTDLCDAVEKSEGIVFVGVDNSDRCTIGVPSEVAGQLVIGRNPADVFRLIEEEKAKKQEGTDT